MRLKKGVRVGTPTGGLLLGIDIVDGIYKEQSIEGWITSLDDSKHGWGSLHFSGNAVDFRTKTIHRDKIVGFVALVAEALGAKLVRARANRVVYSGVNYDVILEGIGTDNEHLHVEFQPKTA